MRDDLAEFHKSWINQSIREICQDISFNCMRTLATVTIDSGSSFVGLPADFKEFTPARPPVHLIGSDNSLTPVDVTRREDIIKLRATFSSSVSSNQSGSLQVYVANDGDSWTLNLLDAAGSETQFQVSYFRILPSLEDENDSNYLTTTYEDLVKAKIKAIAFSEVNDPIAGAWESKYLLAKLRATTDDARRWTRGRRLQMGG